MVIKFKLDGPFTCKKIVINQGAAEWEFKCNAILDIYKKTMNMDNKERNKITFKIKQDPKQISKGAFPLAIMVQGKKGMT